MATGSVQSVDRAFAVLRQIASEPGGISEVARAVELPVSTVARLLGTLEALGAVVRVGGTSTYGIGEGIRALADAMDARATLVARARPVLEELVARTGETSGISVLDGNEVLYLDHVETANEVTLRDWTGSRLPLHVVSSGLVLLAAQPKTFRDAYLATSPKRFTEHSITAPAVIRRRLSTIRQRGRVWTSGEYDAGITSVAAPVVDLGGATVAAIHCHGPSYRFPGETGTDFFDAHVIDAARKLAGLLPHQPVPSRPTHTPPEPKARR
jgi:DNA-binding IclR family transcriptional regulator